MAIRILIVDDDAGFLDVAAELLAERGFEVLDKAMDAAQALALRGHEDPARALIDHEGHAARVTAKTAQ